MVYFVSSNSVYDYPVYPEFLDAPDDNAFGGTTYEQDPEALDLTAVEREFLDKGRPAIGHGYRINGDKAPKKMLWEGGDKALPDVILRNCLAVSPRFRDLVEQFEPGVHQFFPVDIYKTRDGEPVATYYWLNVCNRIDSVNQEKTNLKWTLDYSGKHGFWDDQDVANPVVVFSSEKIGNYHLWHEPNLLVKNNFYVSTAFAEAAMTADFPGLTLTKQLEA